MKADACMFIHRTHRLIVGACVDDVNCALRKEKNYTWFVEKMQNRFDIRDLGDMQECLGLQAHRTPHGGHKLNQEKCTVRLLDKFRIMESERCFAPRAQGAQLYLENSAKFDPTLCRSMVL